MHVIELIQFTLGGSIAAYSLYVIAIEQGANYFFYIGSLILGIGFISAAFMLATNNYLYRATSTVAFIALFALMMLLAKVRIVIVIAGIFIVCIMYLLYIYPPNREYYTWTRRLTK